MRPSSSFFVSFKKILAQSTYTFPVLITLLSSFVNAFPARSPAPEVPPTDDPGSQKNLDNVSKTLVPIDYSRITDSAYSKELLLNVCPFFTEKEAETYSGECFADYGRKELIPLPHNIDHEHLPKSNYIAAVISGAEPILSGRHKKICLNHLAFVVSRRIPYYRFFTPYEFEIMDNVYNHATKIPALMATFKHIQEDGWVLWLDDDVLSSDFMQHPYDDSHVFVGEEETPVKEPLSLLDRVINRAHRLYSAELAEKATEEKPSDSDEYTIPVLPPSVIAIEDSKDAVLNTGVLLVKNDHNGRTLIRTWWFNVIGEQFPLQTEFFCKRARTAYADLKDCLEACKINMARDAHNCGPDKTLSKRISEWNDHKVDGSYLYDQDVFKRLYRWKHKPDNPRPDYISSIRLIKPRQDFGLRTSTGKAVEEAFNAFYRTYSVDGQASALDTLLDKWTHVTGMPPHEKDAYIRTWLTVIVNYPVRQLPNGTSKLLEILPLEKVSDGHDNVKNDGENEKKVDEPMNHQQPAFPSSVSIAESPSDMSLPLYISFGLTMVVVGYFLRIAQVRYFKKRFF